MVKTSKIKHRRPLFFRWSMSMNRLTNKQTHNIVKKIKVSRKSDLPVCVWVVDEEWEVAHRAGHQHQPDNAVVNILPVNKIPDPVNCRLLDLQLIHVQILWNYWGYLREDVIGIFTLSYYIKVGFRGCAGVCSVKLHWNILQFFQFE